MAFILCAKAGNCFLVTSRCRRLTLLMAVDSHGHGGEVVLVADFLVMGEQVEDPLEGFMADARIQVAGKTVVSRFDRGVDGVHNRAKPVWLRRECRRGHRVRKRIAQLVLEFLQDQVQGHHPPHAVR